MLQWRRYTTESVPGPRETAVLTLPLVFALFCLVPASGLLGPAVGIGTLPSLLGALSLVAVGFLSFALARRRLVTGAYVSFFVFSTFGANLPLAEAETFLTMPGSLGPQVWLFQGPLLVIVGLLSWRRAGDLGSVSRTELLLVGFVGWTVLATAFGAGPRPDVSIHFTLLAVQILLVFATVRRGVERGAVGVVDVLVTYVTVLAGHLAFGAVQLFYQRPLGMTFLGEAITWNNVSYPPGFQNALIPSGLTGHGYVLVTLVLLVFPVMVWFVYRFDPLPGGVALVMALLSAMFLRLTTSDAGRGAFLILVISLVMGIVAYSIYRPFRRSSSAFGSLRSLVSSSRRTLASSSATLVLGTVAVLYPSNKSGAASRTGLDRSTPGGPPSNENEAETTVRPTTEPTVRPTTETTATTASTPVDGTVVQEFSVPLFNLTNLGTRLQQYVVGLDIFRRNPVFGVGGGNYPFAAAQYGIPDAPNKPIPQALHNVYIALLAETGLPGFVLYFGAVSTVLWVLLKRCLTDRQPYFHLAVLAGMVGYLAFVFFSPSIYRVTAVLPFWALAGAVVGHSSSGAHDTND